MKQHRISPKIFITSRVFHTIRNKAGNLPTA